MNEFLSSRAVVRLDDPQSGLRWSIVLHPIVRQHAAALAG